MRSQIVLRVFITKACKEKAENYMPLCSVDYLITYIAEQYNLRNYSKKGGAMYMEPPNGVPDQNMVIWLSEIDHKKPSVVFFDIAPRDQGRKDGFAQKTAEICGRFVGGVVGAFMS